MADIDSFIRQQKAKLANERETLNNARGYKPAAPQSQNMANNRGYLDTDAIIRDVQREKQEEEDRRRAANYNNRTGPSPKGFGTTGGGGLDNDEYRKIWERNQQAGQDKSSKPNSEAGLRLIKDEGRDDKLKLMEQERNKEYNDLLKKKRGYQGRPANQQTDDYKATSLLANESDAAKLQKIKERNDEYNQFLANKGQQGGKGGNSGQGSNYATLPGLRYSNSAQRRNQEEERNKEYNEMMRNKAQQRQRGGAPPPAEPKQGWGTPTYEEMLDKKRAQESQYRRANDISHEPDLNVKEGAPTPVPLTGRRSQNDGQYFATLPLGGVSMTEEQRRKEEYKRDLQRQMAETSFARKKEKIEGSLVNNTGAIHLPESHVYIDPYVRPARRVSTLPYNVVNPDLAKLDAISPRSNAILGRRQPTGDLRAEGGLNLSRNLAGDRLTNLNLDVGILDRPSINNQLDPPAGLQYQPS